MVIGRLLARLSSPAGRERLPELDVIVVANGCTDDTAGVAAAYGPPVRVLAIPQASKPAALLAGNEAAAGFPRVYADADVEIGVGDIEALIGALRRPGVLAAGPRRALPMAGRPWAVRWYYDVWTRLPEVRGGLFGRGVIALSAGGCARVASLPALQADDLAWSLAFAPHERVIVAAARVVIESPRTVADLLRRRIRATTGVAQVGRTPGAPPSTARTRPADLLAIASREPLLAPRVAVFAGLTLVARASARRAVRRGDFTTWLRDESSRDSRSGPG
jgi:hypothetical protein